MIILTSGSLSGIGKYLHENLGGIALSRHFSRDEYEKVKAKGVDGIIHCAFNSSREINSNSLYKYVEDNVFLTRDLLSIPHKKFIFFSSVDVYPKNAEINLEDEIIGMDSVKGIYGITKLISESMIKNCCDNYLILRPTSLLGKYSRKNSLIKMIEEKNCTLTLVPHSRFNYVLHFDILSFIKLALDKDLKGIYNISSSENITLSEIAQTLGKNIKFGDYYYDVGNIGNNKISSIFPAFKKTSKEVIIQFKREMYE